MRIPSDVPSEVHAGMSDELITRLQDACARVENARVRSGRSEPVTLLAVSKHQAVEKIAALVSAGHRCFGENYVQEAWKKWNTVQPQFPDAPDLQFHLTGPLQRNKAKMAVGFFALIHSVDRLELASALAKVAAKRGIVQEVLVQVNISRESTKAGVDAEQLPAFCEQLLEYPELRVRGLMSIGQYGLEEEEKRAEYRAMRGLLRDVAPLMGEHFNQLSMGMSGDFELAIEEGATIVRVGTALFGERSKN